MAFGDSLHQYLYPIWKGERVENEPFMFVGKMDKGNFLYHPQEILSVKDYYLEKEFQVDKDYRVVGKTFERLNDVIPYWEEDEYYLDGYEMYAIGANKDICERYGKQKYLKYAEGNTFTQRQIAVTYTHKDSWNGPIPVGKKEKFTNILQKLVSGEKCKILFYGDSITTGCNASGTAQGGMTPPYMPPFPNMICEYLREKYSSEIELINTAVGGMGTLWGLENLDERVISYAPDLVLIGFGMNDPRTPREEYAAMIRSMIEKIHAALPNTEVLLYSSILPNTDSDENWYANQTVFHKDLTEIEKLYGYVGTANITEMQEYIVSTGKHYRDMTANNINHPNDFGHRLYAQVILTTLLGEEFEV